MPRFRLSLWDATGLSQTANLLHVYDLRVEQELNGVYTLSLKYPCRDAIWSGITYRKVIRLEDTYQDPFATTVTNVAEPNLLVADATGFAVGDCIIVFNGPTASSSFIAKVISNVGSELILSRFDFASGYGLPAIGAEVRKVNFTSFRVARLQQKNSNEGLYLDVQCEHIGYDLNDTYFLLDGRGDFSWGIRGGGAVQAENIDMDGLLDYILTRHLDTYGDPINQDKFLKGTLTGIYFGSDYNTGTVTVSNGSYAITGSGTSWISDYVNAAFYVEGDSNRYFVTAVASSTSLRVNKAITRASGSILRYLITKDSREIEFSNDTMRSALVKLCDTWTDNDQVVWFSVNEDKSIDLTAKHLLATDHTDSADPTSNLQVTYKRTGNINTEYIEREYEPKDFANVIIPQGASSEWLNATTGIHTTPAAGGTKKRVVMAAGEGKKFRWGDPVQVFGWDDASDRTTGTFSVSSATQVTVSVAGTPWTYGKYAGGLVLVTAGAGTGQIRRVLTNTTNQLTISRRWDIPPDGTCIVAKNIAETQVRGFGQESYTVSTSSVGGGAGSDYIQVNDVAPSYVNGDYAGGLLEVITGTGAGQVKTLLYNTVGAYGGGGATDVRFYVDGTLSAVTGASFRVTALSQIVEQLDVAFLQARTDATHFTIKTSAVSQTHWCADQWNGGEVYFIDGTGKSLTASYTISDTAWDGSNWQITLSDSLPAGTPDATTAAMLVRETGLPMDIEPITFNADADCEVVLLVKETGGTLTIGKHADSRSTVLSATIDQIKVQSGDGAKFLTVTGDPTEKRVGVQSIFVGAKTITSAVLFGIRRGDQSMGQVIEVYNISSDTLTLASNLDPVPQPGDHVEILTLADATSETNYKRREKIYSSDTNDPVELRRQTEIYLDAVATPKPCYKVKFTHLYELDPRVWNYWNYSLGDTIRVIDDELNIDDDTLRIVKESWNPLNPADVQVEIAATELRKIETILTRVASTPSLRGRPGTGMPLKPVTWGNARTNTRLAPVLLTVACTYWDEEGKMCRRQYPPNTYCNSEESGRNGRTTAQGTRITYSECQAYRRLRLHSAGDSDAILHRGSYGERVKSSDSRLKFASVAGTGNWQTVDPTSYITDADNVDFVVTSALAILEEVEDTVAPAYAANYSGCDVRIKTSGGTGAEAGEIANPYGIIAKQDIGNNLAGFTIEVKVPLTKTYDLYVRWTATGYES